MSSRASSRLSSRCSGACATSSAYDRRTGVSAPRRAWAALASLRLTLVCLAALTVLVVACTLAEARLGVFRAVEVFMHSGLVYAPVGGLRIPVFPGGALIGAVLVLNLVAVQTRLELSRARAGLWLMHLGLILLFAGEFVNGLVRHEAQMALGPGQTLDYAEDARRVELLVTDETEPGQDRVYAVSEDALRRHADIGRPQLPFDLRVNQYAERYQDEQILNAEADVEVAAGPLSGEGGRWIVSLREPGVRFRLDGRRYLVSLRRARRYLPVALTLTEFRRELYPGSDIPRSFTSRVSIAERAGAQPPRPAVISMNSPLRAGGLTFYQASFAEDGRVSVLEVVDNPAWALPYISCALVSLGLLIHFVRRLSLSAALRA